MKIVILDGYTINPGDNPWDPILALGNLVVYDRTPPDLKLERSREADIILTSKVKLDADTIKQLPNLKYISMLATGYNNIDVAAAGAQGVPVSNIPAYSTESVVQTAFGLLLELASGIGLHDRSVKGGEWCRNPDHSYWKQSIVELDGLTLGIIGYGTIGRAMARVGAAFGMRIIAHAPRLIELEWGDPKHPRIAIVGKYVELHDAYTSSEIQTYEDLGLCRYGEGGAFVDAGAPFLPNLDYGLTFSESGRWPHLPVNPSGGLLACGHPVGATGLMQAIFAFWQLQGTIAKHLHDPTLQLPNPQRGLIHSHAGTGTYITVSILEQIGRASCRERV